MGNIKFGVIGCGDIAKSMLLVFKLTRGVSVTALCDINKDRLSRAGKRFKKAELYTDYAELIEKADCDAVYIALPHYLHYPVMKKALENKKHILCEKPITINEKNAREIIEEAKASDLKVAINYQYRYDNNCHRLVRAVKNGDLGKVNFIRCSVPWSRNKKYFEMAPWHASFEKSGGGTLMTQGSHLLDIILWMSGCGIKTVSGICKRLKFIESETEDFCMVDMVLENGVPVQFLSTMAAPFEGRIRLEVFGSEGFGEYTKLIGSKVRFRKVKPDKYRYGKPAVHAVQKGLRDFRDSIISGKNHLCPGEEAVRVLAAINTIYGNTEGVYREGI